MKCARLYRPGQLEIADIPEPVLTSSDEVKIRVRYGAVNADDYNTYIGKLGQPYGDFGLFHEISGEIVQAGAYSQRVGFQVGDFVAASPFLPCGACPACRSGHMNLCFETFTDGLLAEYIILSHKRLYHIPKGVSLRQGSLTWLALTCVRCIERLAITPGQSILILGAGSAGQLLVQLAKKRLPGILAVSEPLQSKRAMALASGADAAIDSTAENLIERALKLTSGIGFDIIIDAAGDSIALQNSVDLLSRGGKLMVFSSYDISSYLRLNLADLYWKECTVMAAYGATNAEYTQADTQILAQLTLEPLIGKEFPMQQLKQAFEAYGTRLYTRILVYP